jgi:transcriptional antiterminator NusG
MNETYHIGQQLEPLVRHEMPAPGNERWHVARVRTGSERKTIDFLQARQFGIYAPRTRVWRTVAQRYMSHAQRATRAVIKRPKEVYLYPGYLLLCFDIERRDWERTFDFLSISGLMSRYEAPTVIRDSEINRVKSLEVNGLIPGTVEMTKVIFKIGEEVRVCDGPFAHFNGIIEELPVDLAAKLHGRAIEELDDSFRAKVAVNIFGRSTPVNLALAQIEKL